MKLLTFLSLLSISTFAATPLDMKLGYWEHTTDFSENAMMKMAMESIKSLPKAQQDKIMKKMGMTGDFKKTYKCFTKEDMKNWEQKIMEGMGRKDCDMKVLKSTKSIYKANLICQGGKYTAEIFVKMKNNKEGQSVAKINAAQGPLKVNMKWLKSTCPKS